MGQVNSHHSNHACTGPSSTSGSKSGLTPAAQVMGPKASGCWEHVALRHGPLSPSGQPGSKMITERPELGGF
eukprot:symbB.v1.2.030288.t1/scaffold3398.1/size57691/2